jgi:mannose/fructose/N-acetylgalactosamine-specific phosphotransferase system component IIB
MKTNVLILNTKITNNCVSDSLLKSTEPRAVDAKLKNIEVKINVLMFLKGQTNNFL